ncbi:MAG TPA: carboxypeptidase-like regulatory domain-containing protein, partial [Pyrinomonadaceae bacterium]|nr:carboxypeptidase-like regulatory domain-containing protein [Pyrinomonadaceae bacterium]
MVTKETRVQESTCAVPVFERNRYFYGKPMTVRDFEAEQRYLIGKSHFLNRLIYGAGILCGLQVQVFWNVENNKPSVQLSEGAALDCCGNLIVVSRLGPVVVEGEFQDGLNYLSIQYAECVKQPIMASTNASSCKEVCCYNRVQETFKVSVSADAPAVADATVSGTVQEKSGGRAIHGARVEALGKGKVRASTLTDAQGAYTLRVSSGEYDLRASGSGFNASQATRRKISKSPAVTLDFKLDAATSETNAAALCNQLTQNYFEEHLREPPECHDPKVLLAVVKIEPGTMRGTRPIGKTEVVTVNAEETRKHRPVVNNNPMLHDLLCAHVADFNNPHRTDASQVRALRSINHVGNSAQGAYQSNVDLVSEDGSITINPDATDNGNDIDLKLSADAVKREHLNADVFNNLVVARDFGINVTSKPADRRIELSMGAPQQVKSVRAVSDVGASKLFAREDHVHNLQINGRGPDTEGNLLLTGGQNVTVVAGRANELVINAQGGGSGDITSGLLIFANVQAGETRLSQPIPHGLDVNRVGIILSLEFQNNDVQTRIETSSSLAGASPAGVVANTGSQSSVMGDFAEVYPRSP